MLDSNFAGNVYTSPAHLNDNYQKWKLVSRRLTLLSPSQM